jgi:hypothetical protein
MRLILFNFRVLTDCLLILAAHYTRCRSFKDARLDRARPILLRSFVNLDLPLKARKHRRLRQSAYIAEIVADQGAHELSPRFVQCMRSFSEDKSAGIRLLPMTRLICLFALFLACAAATGQPAARISSPHLADYDAELRQTDGQVNIEAMVHRLQELDVTTYYWLIWHASTDWDDLKLFLPKAAEAKIQVWVYLVPPSEGPPGGYPASEPFKLDYLRWGEEIARLSLQNTNLTGWVIDDFYANHQLFTPTYIRQMQAKAKAISPGLAFLPLMYFNETTAQFVDSYQEVIDGVVVAYPQDREEILYARAVLNGQTGAMPRQFSCPGNTPTQAGDYASAAVSARVLSTNHAWLHFAEEDDFTGPTSGYHLKQLLVDGAVVWEQDVAAGTTRWQSVDVNVAKQVAAKTNMAVVFRLFDKKGVSNFGVRWRLKNLRAEGMELSAALDAPQQWKVDLRGPFESGFGNAVHPSPGRLHVPFIVMTAGSRDEFKLRHGEPASPERIAEWLSMCLKAWQDGQCEGVVTYCLDKSPGSQVFPLAQRLFREKPRWSR